MDPWRPRGGRSNLFKRAKTSMVLWGSEGKMSPRVQLVTGYGLEVPIARSGPEEKNEGGSLTVRTGGQILIHLRLA